MFTKKKKEHNFSRSIVAVVSDIHANSKVAVCPPRVQLDGGGEWIANRRQKWLYQDVWEPYWEELWETKKRLKWPLFTVLGGEAADNNKHTSTELISHNSVDQLRIPMKLLKTALEISDFVIIVRGTEAHVGDGSWMDEKIADDIQGDVRVVKNNDGDSSWYNFRGMLGGVYFDMAHHPGHGAMRPWTKGGDANRLAADILYRYVEHNLAMRRQGKRELELEIPDVVWRGHNHNPTDSADNHPIRAIVGASWQLTSGFGYRLGGRWLPVGGMYFLCDRGRYDIHKRHQFWPLDQYWVPLK